MPIFETAPGAESDKQFGLIAARFHNIRNSRCLHSASDHRCPQPSPQRSGCGWLVVGVIVGGLTTLGMMWLSARVPRIDYEPAAVPSEARPAPAAAEIPILVPTPYPPLHELLNSANAARVAQLARGGKGWVSEMAFSPDGWLLAVASSLGVYLYAAADLSEMRFLPTDAPVLSAAFSPDRRLLASLSDDSTIRLWNAAGGALLRTLEGHTADVNSVAFSPDGRTLASGSGDGTMRLWRVR